MQLIAGKMSMRRSDNEGVKISVVGYFNRVKQKYTIVLKIKQEILGFRHKNEIYFINMP